MSKPHGEKKSERKEKQRIILRPQGSEKQFWRKQELPDRSKSGAEKHLRKEHGLEIWLG